MTAKPTKKADPIAVLRRLSVVCEANRHLALYLKTGDGLLIWRAYQECRSGGLPIPESILKKFDQFGVRLVDSESVQDIAKALEMASDSGPAGARRTRGREHQRNIVEYVHLLRGLAQRVGLQREADDIYADAAKRFHTTKGYAKRLYLEWTRVPGQDRRRKK